ncbi:MAG: stage V sporulation protein AD [Bacilli bacterium]|nr:stage V sporulation protein AD [Bacilli bacterium]
MTYFFNQVYIEETATICGPYEKKGPLRRYFDKTYDDLYCGKTSFEKAEIQLVKDVIVMLLKKSGYKKEEIDVVMGGDLSNQITATTYGSLGVGNGFVGIYAACSTSSLGLLLSACLIQGGFVQNSLCMVSSHNLSSERQFRYPIEYGSLRPHTSTFTATGAGACLLSSEKSDVRIDCATLGRVMDYEQTDPNDMGRVMAPGVIDTLKRHLEDTGRNASYYDLIVTGDLGKYGVEIVRDYFQKEYQLSLPNLQDCGVLLYDLEKQKEIHAGGSGPVCSALVVYSYLYSLLREKKYKRVLLLATGALFSPMMLYQKQNIPCVCHAVSLEAV